MGTAEEHVEVIEEYIGKERLARRLLGRMGRGEYPPGMEK